LFVRSGWPSAWPAAAAAAAMVRGATPIRLSRLLRLRLRRRPANASPTIRGIIARDDERRPSRLLDLMVTKPGLLSGIACRVALAAMVAAATAAHADADGASVTGTRCDEAAAYHLKTSVPLSIRTAIRGPSFDISIRSGEYRPNRGCGAQGQARLNASLRIEGLADRSAPRPPNARMPFDLETLPVKIGGRRFVLSRFTLDRRGVLGMISTRF
jgi:hypothetical protein